MLSLKSYQKQLEKLLTEVNEAIAQSEQNDNEPEHIESTESSMDEDYAVSQNGRKPDTILEELKDHQDLILKALARIKRGSFGKCIRCRKNIAEKRLKAIPYTPYCIDCQEKLEK